MKKGKKHGDLTIAALPNNGTAADAFKLSFSPTLPKGSWTLSAEGRARRDRLVAREQQQLRNKVKPAPIPDPSNQFLPPGTPELIFPIELIEEQTVESPVIPLDKNTMNLVDLDNLLKTAEETKNRSSVESIAREMEVEQALITGFEKELQLIEAQKTELAGQKKAVEERRAKLESLKQFIPAEQFKSASAAIGEMEAGIELRVEHLEASANSEVSVALFEHQTKFDALKKQMQAFPLEMRIDVVAKPATVTSQPVGENEDDLKRLKERIKHSGVLAITKKKVLGVYGNMPGSNQDVLIQAFGLHELFSRMPSAVDQMLQAIASKRVIGVVAWKYMADVNALIHACQKVGIPFVVIDRPSKNYLLKEVSKVFGFPL